MGRVFTEPELVQALAAAGKAHPVPEMFMLGPAVAIEARDPGMVKLIVRFSQQPGGDLGAQSNAS